MRVNVEDVLDILEKKKKINDLDFSSIEFYRGNMKVIIPPEVLDDWMFTGLNNINFFEFFDWENMKLWQE